MSRVIKFEIMFLVSTKEFEKKVAKHYTTLDRMIDGSDSFDYSAVDIIAKRQFTGLTDVNDVDIYEGDLFYGVSSSFGAMSGAVCLSGYDDSEEYVHVRHLGWHVDGTPLCDLVNDGFKVVGNIHEITP